MIKAYRPIPKIAELRKGRAQLKFSIG